MEGVRLEREWDVLLFPDCKVLIANSAECLQMIQKLNERLTRWKMKVNWKKTEVMKVGKERGHWCMEVGDWRLDSMVVRIIL